MGTEPIFFMPNYPCTDGKDPLDIHVSNEKVTESLIPSSQRFGISVTRRAGEQQDLHSPA